MAWGVLVLLLGSVSGLCTSYQLYGLVFYGGETPPMHLGTCLTAGIGTAIAALAGLSAFINSTEVLRVDRLKYAGLALLAFLGVIAITFAGARIGGRVAVASFLLGPGAVGAFVGYLVGAMFLPSSAKP
jgi:hypothetical protein